MSCCRMTRRPRRRPGARPRSALPAAGRGGLRLDLRLHPDRGLPPSLHPGGRRLRPDPGHRSRDRRLCLAPEDGRRGELLYRYNRRRWEVPPAQRCRAPPRAAAEIIMNNATPKLGSDGPAAPILPAGRTRRAVIVGGALAPLRRPPFRRRRRPRRVLPRSAMGAFKRTAWRFFIVRLGRPVRPYCFCCTGSQIPPFTSAT